MKAREELQNILDQEFGRLKTTFQGPPYWAFQNIIRRLDFILPLLTSSTKISQKELTKIREYFKYGWSPLIKHYFNEGNLEAHKGFPFMDEETITWTDSNVIYSGMLELCKQLLAYEKSGILNLHFDQNKNIYYSYTNDKINIERFELESQKYMFNNLTRRVINERKEKYQFNEDEVRNELRKIISSPDGVRIKYNATPLIDKYYNKAGHYHLLEMQGYDNFGDTDLFGSIPYKKYIDFIEIIMGVARMHVDACIELVSLNPKINLHNILAHTHERDRTIKTYSKYLKLSKEEIDQILSCITLSKENYKYYLDYPKTSPPMYFQVSDKLFIRSIAGCLIYPFDLLNRELKRKYKRDYDKAVNRREERFRTDLFFYFPQNRIIKIPNEININFNGSKTDIDAVVFDIKTGTLGLFQLKWQDPFTNSMVERYSRMKNLFPKANEWIGKIRTWIKESKSKTILNALQIDRKIDKNHKLNSIYLFVISRNTLNFTGRIIDDFAAWSSWLQLFQSESSIKTDFDDPIREMFFKIKAFKAENRESFSDSETIGLDLMIGDKRVYYKKRKSG